MIRFDRVPEPEEFDDKARRPGNDRRGMSSTVLENSRSKA